MPGSLPPSRSFANLGQWFFLIARWQISFISFSALHTLQNMKLQLQRRTVRFNEVILTNHLAIPPAP